MLRMAVSADQRTLRKGCWGWYHRTWVGRMGAPRVGHVKAVTLCGGWGAQTDDDQVERQAMGAAD